MQDAFGCAVKNRFFHLLDDESDPLDILHQASVEISRRKKKGEAAAAKKTGNKRESQKDRKAFVIETSTEAPDQKHAPKQSLYKGIQNENSGAQVKADRAERRPAFREFRSNIERPLEYSMDNFEKEKLVRNWIANQRGGRGGFSRNTDYDNQRGKREFDRHSGNDRTEVEAAHMESVEVNEIIDVTEEEQDIKLSEDSAEDHREMSLDEWKSMQVQNRPKIELNLRKPETSMPSKAVVIHKSKFKNNLEGFEDDQQCGLRKPVNDITFQLDINFGSLPRPGRGGRGGGRGRGRREETYLHDMTDVQEFLLNPDDPEDFPALS
ncbi:intracellular hyaluronan-binding protein 4 isoform X2 [Mixophyes fleayi]|uniref:intracellular hyaluronan-binding protein 4 isoform X2 n=1 Tax=Mixophyes fleayi TaxID=3061075 RepID=UPI003F4DAA0A